MNEEFAIKLKMVMDQSSIASVMDHLKKVQNVAEDIQVPTAHATELFDVDNVEEYSAELAYLLYQIDELSEIVRAMHERPDLWSEEAILKAEAELERLYKKLEKIRGNSLVAVQETSVEINNNFGGMAKKIARIGLALVGVRGVYASITKAMNSYLAQNTELKNKIDACWYALGSLFAPVVEWIVNLFVKLVSLVDAFVKALGFAGINMDKYGKKAGKAQKQLAGFDEINNISEQSGSGATNPFGGFELGDKFKEFANLIKGNIEILKLMGLGAMFGIGVAFLFTGHPMIGLGMILTAGVLSYTKVAENWNYIVEKVGGVKNAILALLAGFSFGLGAILLFSGHPALGLGLIMAGITVASQVIDWSMLSSNIQQEISRIMGIIAVSSVAIGFILLMIGMAVPSVLGLGLALLVGGLGMGMGKVAFDTKYLSGAVGESLDNVEGEVDSKLPVIESNIGNAWDNIKGDTDISWNNIEGSIYGSLKDSKNDVYSMSNGMYSIFAGNNNSIYNNTNTKWSSIASLIINKMGEIRQKLGQKWESLKQWWAGLSLGSFKIPLPHFSLGTNMFGMPKINVDWYASGGVFTGPQVIGVGEYSGSSNNPEVVAPLNSLTDYMDSGNEETNDLLRELIDVVGSKEFRAYISQSEIGKSAVNYINQQSRILGSSVI